MLRLISRGVTAATAAAFLALNWQWWSGFDVTLLGPTVALVVLSAALDLFVAFRETRRPGATTPPEG